MPTMRSARPSAATISVLEAKIGHDALRRRGHGDAAIEGVAHRDRLGAATARPDRRGTRQRAERGARRPDQNLNWKPTMTSRPGIELPQAPFWLARLAPHGDGVQGDEDRMVVHVEDVVHRARTA